MFTPANTSKAFGRKLACFWLQSKTEKRTVLAETSQGGNIDHLPVPANSSGGFDELILASIELFILASNRTDRSMNSSTSLWRPSIFPSLHPFSLHPPTHPTISICITVRWVRCDGSGVARPGKHVALVVRRLRGRRKSLPTHPCRPYMCVCMCAFMHTFMHVCMHACMRTRMRKRTGVCNHACARALVCLRICAHFRRRRRRRRTELWHWPRGFLRAMGWGAAGWLDRTRVDIVSCSSDVSLDCDVSLRCWCLPWR